MCQDWLDLWYIRPPAPHILQHIGAPAPGWLDPQDIGTPLLGPLQSIDPGPLLPELCQHLFEALGVHAVLCVLSREMKVTMAHKTLRFGIWREMNSDRHNCP